MLMVEIHQRDQREHAGVLEGGGRDQLALQRSSATVMVEACDESFSIMIMTLP